MINLKDILYVRLGTRDIEGAVRYAQGILGLEPVASIGNSKNGQARYFRSDAREHTLAYFDGDPQDHTAGFEVASHADLDAAGAELERLGHAVKVGTAGEAEVRGVEAFINFRDPSGNSLDLAVKPFFSGNRRQFRTTVRVRTDGPDFSITLFSPYASLAERQVRLVVDAPATINAIVGPCCIGPAIARQHLFQVIFGGLFIQVWISVRGEQAFRCGE